MLFGEGRKLLRAVLASMLFGVVVVIGFLLLIAPGVYLALKYGQFMTAIVDRDLGVMESFSYSASITTNNRLSLLGLWFLCILVVLAGALACGVGLVFAIPVAWLSSARRLPLDAIRPSRRAGPPGHEDSDAGELVNRTYDCPPTCRG